MYVVIPTVVLAIILALMYLGRGYWAWTSATLIALVAWGVTGVERPMLFSVITATAVVAMLVFGVLPLRRALVSRHLVRPMEKVLPRLGDTERVALEAGTVWWDGELFSARPNWKKLLDFEPRPMSQREREFLDGPVEDLCEMLNEWEIAQRRDLPDDVWQFLKQHRFFGMIIPEQYGGLGFSALAHSAVVTKIASRSVTAAVTVMVPNSLGPAELLLHYGTDEQKSHYLPRFARGEDIPCFALTGPEAGSDAAATQSTGVIQRGTFRGEQVLGIWLNWRKRYITLAPVATLIGLAFRLRDPDGLLGDTEDLGITCALIPRDLAGIEIGQRHDPMGVPFHNGPIIGRNVFVPLEFIIGGRAGAGQGWRMLMESLAAGRSISLPALAVSAAQLATRVVGAYATVREQFDTPIGRFEGIEEPLARIAGRTYLMDAARTLTCGALDDGARPAVLSAIVKTYLTECMRNVLMDAMDIRAGAGICRGPRNVLAQVYAAVPIGITVEGANILTRSMIIYGQGAIRSHPFVHKEIEAVRNGDVAGLDRAVFGHVNFMASNVVRSLLLGLTAGHLSTAPIRGPLSKYFRILTRFSTAFALLADATLITLGGTLKRREKISGRLADALACMYLASAALKRFVDEDQPQTDRALVQWSCILAFYEIQEALRGVLDNLPNRKAAGLLRALVFPWGARLRLPSDELGAVVVKGLLEDRELRLRLTKDIFVPPSNEPGLGRLEAALNKAVDGLTVEAKIRDAIRKGLLDRAPGDQLAEGALEAGIISVEERRQLSDADEARDEVIQVDAFDPNVYVTLHG